tara:strand:+ start:5679 stop:5876 length:198 start_codon:yes stop_codon:yes gene_type:complete
MSFEYSIGDKVADKQSMRMGTVVDLVEERDPDGTLTYRGVKMEFEDGTSDWITGDRVAKMLLEDT